MNNKIKKNVVGRHEILLQVWRLSFPTREGWCQQRRWSDLATDCQPPRNRHQLPPISATSPPTYWKRRGATVQPPVFQFFYFVLWVLPPLISKWEDNIIWRGCTIYFCILRRYVILSLNPKHYLCCFIYFIRDIWHLTLITYVQPLPRYCQLPDFYFFPPFFTIQPVLSTREDQLEQWRELILKYRESLIGPNFTASLVICIK